jgi:light-regulated signal transduction histidine kinase (bacteriophytochrome)
LQIANQELESFSYSVSHDLRAPLRALSGYSKILIEDYSEKLDEEGKQTIQAITHNAERMGMLIDDLLAFSRLGRKEVVKTEVDMKKLVESIVLESSKMTPHDAIIKVGELPLVNGDYALLHQVIFNLISNAVKYSSKQKSPLIEISSEEESDEIVISVKDNGVGFDMQYANKLFGVFQRLHARQEFEGTGVGLAIVKRIIARHGGKVWAEGKVNEGAEFYFSLPK